MPKDYTLDGKTYRLADGLTDQEAYDIITEHEAGAPAPVAPSTREAMLPKKESSFGDVMAWRDQMMEPGGGRAIPQTPEELAGQTQGGLTGAGIVATSMIPGGGAKTLAGQAMRGAGTAAAAGAVSDVVGSLGRGSFPNPVEMVKDSVPRAITGAVLGPALSFGAKRIGLLQDLIRENPNLARLVRAVTGEAPVVAAAEAGAAKQIVKATGKPMSEALKTIRDRVATRKLTMPYDVSGQYSADSIAKLLEMNFRKL